MRYIVMLIGLLVSACNSPVAPTPVSSTPPAVTPPPPTPQTVTSYAGRWSGSYVVEQCAGSSGSTDDVLCSAPRAANPGGIFQRGETFPITLELSQTGNAATGTLILGLVRGTVSGSVLSNQLVLSGTVTHSDAALGLVLTITISNWDTSLSSGLLQGTFSLNVKINVLPGDGVVRVRLSNVRREQFGAADGIRR